MDTMQRTIENITIFAVRFVFSSKNTRKALLAAYPTKIRKKISAKTPLSTATSKGTFIRNEIEESPRKWKMEIKRLEIEGVRAIAAIPALKSPSIRFL